MNDLLVLLAMGASLAVFYAWAFRFLPREEWQIMAAVPVARQEPGVWRGRNLTWYGFFAAMATAASVTLLLVLLGSLGVPVWATALLVALTLAACLPAAGIVARWVEGRQGLTVAGAFFVACVAVPLMIPLVNVTAGAAFGLHIPWLPTLAAAALAYTLGEGMGRLACISFGCCYGRPLSDCHALVRRVFARRHFAFAGTMKKAAYDGGLEHVPLVPIQALTAVCYALLALVGTWLFLRGAFGAAMLTAVAGTQGWRFLSEFLRADWRGGGKLSAYQAASLVAVAAAGAAAMAVPDAPASVNFFAGLRGLYDPAALVLVQAAWVAVFWRMGRSTVTESVLHCRLKADAVRLPSRADLPPSRTEKVRTEKVSGAVSGSSG